MFLKQLDIVGFKSFANRINIDFVPGVTAVVGPNGSGKSNISDAVRWVLGEQSAKSLRGGKMEDIIFAGSDDRKPLNVAEVTLTLDNEDQYLPLDYNEISVTRRVYRSGDSEYLINRQPCRLKDIVDLFLDSGLGREAYSVIGQGKIDEILNSKSEEKRKIFEEAAGVLKYKTRKLKAEKKLGETEDNLSRVDDILHELSSQVEPLKMQASIAKEYLEKKAELEQTEVALIVYEIEDYHKRWTELSETVKDLETQELALSATINEEDADIEKKRSEIQALDGAIDRLQDELLSVSEELEKLEGHKEVLKERKKNANQNRELLKERIASYKDKIKKNAVDLEAKQEELQAAEERLLETKRLLEEEASKYASMERDAETELEHLKTEYIEVLNKQATIRNEIRYLKEQRTQIEAKSERLDADHEKFIAERENLHERKAKLVERLAIEKQRLDEFRDQYVQLQNQLKADSAAAKEKEASLRQLQQEVQQKRSRKEMLEAMQEDYSGFFQGVKSVLKAGLSGIEGAVAELIQVPKEYETAIETALGASMQHVVVDKEEHAREAIAHLKKTSGGRATFLPMSVIQPRSLSSADVRTIEGNEAYIGAASELVASDPRYRNIVGNLLGTVIVAKTLRGANELARLLRHRFRIVTLDGDVVNPGGSMSGGSRKQQSNSLLSRQRELEDTVKRLKKIEKEAARLEEEVAKSANSIQAGTARLEELREQGEALRIEEQKRDGERREMDIEERNVNERLALYDREKAGFREELTAIDGRLEELETTLAEVGESERKLDAAIAELTERKQHQETTKEHAQSAITELKVKEAEQEQQAAYLRDEVERVKGEREENERLLGETEEEFWLLEEDMNNNSSGEERLEEAIDVKRKEKDATVEKISGRRKQRLDMQQLIEDKERELKEVKRSQKQHADMLKAEEVKQNRLEVELDNRLNVLQEEYELSFEAAKMQYQLTDEPEEARRQVKLIKRAIEDLGTVNLGAIDEYERVSERYTFLSEQKEDLKQAEQNLLDVITEMDEEVVKRFEQTFTQVREHFRVIFKELFGGGRADLQLSDPEDLLNTGVDVLAQPPGKKLQHLALLSGGERALTAITLLFAILKVRPVPFCVLDEVEAALDDANVDRFAGYMKKFSSQTQFVVITHRKGTMEEADVLYGVTMQESGVSNLVSVRLEESKQLVETS
ncbi:MAG TPA: chromosome segregation protein SMC [Bacillales bacterium]|nr:chromosome segregation protein SMC [Bacillales bacterium]